MKEEISKTSKEDEPYEKAGAKHGSGCIVSILAIAAALIGIFFFNEEGAKDYLEVYPGEQAQISLNSGLQSLEGYHSILELNVGLEIDGKTENLICEAIDYKKYTDEMLSNANIQVITYEDIPVSVIEDDIVLKMEVEIPAENISIGTTGQISIDGLVTYPIVDVTKRIGNSYIVTDTTRVFNETYSVNFREQEDESNFYDLLNKIYVIVLLLGFGIGILKIIQISITISKEKKEPA